jgi:hypothetical protein
MKKGPFLGMMNILMQLRKVGGREPLESRERAVREP